jgi:hypothetical protein
MTHKRIATKILSQIFIFFGIKKKARRPNKDDSINTRFFLYGAIYGGCAINSKLNPNQKSTEIKIRNFEMVFLNSGIDDLGYHPGKPMPRVYSKNGSVKHL